MRVPKLKDNSLPHHGELLCITASSEARLPLWVISRPGRTIDQAAFSSLFLSQDRTFVAARQRSVRRDAKPAKLGMAKKLLTQGVWT